MLLPLLIPTLFMLLGAKVANVIQLPLSSQVLFARVPFGGLGSEVCGGKYEVVCRLETQAREIKGSHYHI